MTTHDKTVRFHEARGGRKTAAARARIFFKAGGQVTVNGKGYRDYFRTVFEQAKVMAPIELLKINDEVHVTVTVKGGGIHAQAEAVRNGIAKAIAAANEEFKKRLKRAGFITRDARAVERKKYGLKKARRAPQWQKR